MFHTICVATIYTDSDRAHGYIHVVFFIVCTRFKLSTKKTWNFLIFILIHFICELGNNRIAEILIWGGAPLDVQNYWGGTPLIMAAVDSNFYS